jgi:2'-5' RNA ligase
VDAPHALQAHYDAILAGSIDAIRAGDVELDPHLQAGADARRGLTVIARPDAALTARLDGVLDILETIAPGQYRQPGADLHVTVLALSTACEDYHAELARLPDYRAAVRAALAGMPAFDIEFRGLSASRSAVLAQGFPLDGTLGLVRERLRAQLRARGLDTSLDSRYTIVAAHATLLRFVRPLPDPARLGDALMALRTTPLGTLRVDSVDLVRNDWTMSSRTLQKIEAFALA